MPNTGDDSSESPTFQDKGPVSGNLRALRAGYFKGLNYTLANEDTSLELAILREGVRHVVSVAGSGGRVLPLLSKKPEYLTCVDLSPEQLFLTELRLESARRLSRESFLSFWGYPKVDAGASASDSAEARKRTFEELQLGADARDYLRQAFEQVSWNSLLYSGKWETLCARTSVLNRALTGSEGKALFEARTIEEQRDHVARKFPRASWLMFLRFIGNANFFNSLLYKGNFPRNNLGLSMFELYRERFDQLFHSSLARENFFLQIVFFGKVVFPEGMPIECDPDVHRHAQEALICPRSTKIAFAAGDVIELVRKCRMPIDFLSLSDVPSYWSGERERSFLQDIRSAMAPGALIVVRNYLHIPRNLDVRGYENISSMYSDAISREKVNVYEIDVFRKR